MQRSDGLTREGLEAFFEIYRNRELVNVVAMKCYFDVHNKIIKLLQMLDGRGYFIMKSGVVDTLWLYFVFVHKIGGYFDHVKVSDQMKLVSQHELELLVGFEDYFRNLRLVHGWC